jgi:hypothetical protein
MVLAVLTADPPISDRVGELRDKFLSITTLFSASRSVASLAYSHPASSLLYAPPVLALLAIPRFKQCGVRSRRRMLTYRMIRGLLLLLAIWLDAAEMLRSTPLSLG